jgi:hypothetical protein
MNWSRGLFRVWIALTVFWILGAGVHFQREYARCCKPPFDPSKPFDPAELPVAPWIDVYASDLIFSGIVIVVVPLAVLLLGLVSVWVIRGFRPTDTGRTVAPTRKIGPQRGG